ncbi:amino acid adenylation protein [Hassallia byssoidea VB512170]|uniref:Amino acid adenylation protein n=2 Tax=Hassallia TaxID=482629 RepID=A0A846HJX3_9CYAN|nr:amino acid adenylation protein [Hassalia byssoidea VB512170]
MKLGFDISEPCLVTSLGWYANKYPEIAERCNKALLELIDKQAATTPPELVAAYSEIDMDGF